MDCLETKKIEIKINNAISRFMHFESSRAKDSTNNNYSTKKLHVGWPNTNKYYRDESNE